MLAAERMYAKYTHPGFDAKRASETEVSGAEEIAARHDLRVDDIRDALTKLTTVNACDARDIEAAQKLFAEKDLDISACQSALWGFFEPRRIAPGQIGHQLIALLWPSASWSESMREMARSTFYFKWSAAAVNQQCAREQAVKEAEAADGYTSD